MASEWACIVTAQALRQSETVGEAMVKIGTLLSQVGVWRTLQAGVQLGVKGLEEVAGEGVGSILTRAAGHFCEHHGVVLEASRAASERAWRSLELWLDRDRVLDRGLLSADDRAFQAQIETFFQKSVEPAELRVHGSDLAFREHCLRELRLLRESGELEGFLNLDELAGQVSLWGGFANPLMVLNQMNQVWVSISQSLQQRHPHLAKLLGVTWDSESSPPYLVAAFEYYFTEAITKDPNLFQKLAWLQLRRQNQSLDVLVDAMARYDSHWNNLFQNLHDRFGKVDRIENMLIQVINFLNLNDRQLSPNDSCSLQHPTYIQNVKTIRQELRSLSLNERDRRPQILINKIKAAFATGEFDEAMADAEALAASTSDHKIKANAIHCQYQVALEQERWDDALGLLREAVELDQSLEPFPFHKYEAKQILGAGGFGVAFLCHLKYSQTRQVVIKSLLTEVEDPFAELKVLDEVHHPNIIKIDDCDYVVPTQKQKPYLLMPYFDGLSLKQWVEQNGPLSVDDFCQVALQAAQAFEHAHQKGVYHGDVTPSNILVRKKGSTWEVRLIDFGLARKTAVKPDGSTGPSFSQSQSRSRANKRIAGTLNYMAPEQREGRRISVKTDIYGFGKTAYFALTRTHSPGKRMTKTLPEWLDDLLDQCLEEDVLRRPESFQEISQQVRTGGVLQATDRVHRPVTISEPMTPPPPTVENRPVVSEPPRQPPPPPPKSEGRPKEVRQDNQLGMKLIWCPPGSFRMGSPKTEANRHNDEAQVDVALTRGFWMGQYPVTQGQWEAVMGKRDSVCKLEWGQGPNLAMYTINWNEAVEFCEKLTKLETEAKRLPPGWVYRLPTEAEWEYACRAGTKTAYWFGDSTEDLVKYGWCADNSGKTAWDSTKFWDSLVLEASKPKSSGFWGWFGGKSSTQGDSKVEKYDAELRKNGCGSREVGQKPPNPWGLHDLHGGVWEWCMDAFQTSLPGGRDPLVRGDGAVTRVLRGGSWYNNPRVCRSAYRDGRKPDYRFINYGFRVVAALPVPPKA